MITLVVSPAELVGKDVTVDGPAYRHLFRARRLAAGALVRVVDGEGKARWARAETVEASRARLVLDSPAPSKEPILHLELFAPIPKASRLSWMVEKATEIGVSAIRLLSSERAPRGASAASLARLRRVAVAAVEQSQRSVVPPVSGTHEFAELPDLLESMDVSLFLQPGAAAPHGGAAAERAAILVGPEGGWAQGEIDQLQSWGCRPMGLGPTVLRIETAAIVGCANLLLQQHGR